MGFNGPIGIDIPAAAQIAHTAGCDQRALMLLLPFLSSGFVAGCGDAKESSA